MPITSETADRLCVIADRLRSRERHGAGLTLRNMRDDLLDVIRILVQDLPGSRIAVPRDSLGGPRIRVSCCGDVIRSGGRHDYVTCACGKSFVDGGSGYLRWGSTDPVTTIEEVPE